MTTHTCDGCGKTLSQPGISRLQAIDFCLSNKDWPGLWCHVGGPKKGASDLDELYNPAIPFTCEFETKNLAFCHDCVLNAFKKAVAQLV